MDLKKTKDPEFPYEVTFRRVGEFDEIETVISAFREAIYRRAEKGNAGSISDWDIWVTTWEDHSKIMQLQLRSIADVADVLEEFADDTDEAIVEIPEITNIPPYANVDIPERQRIGKAAMELASQIRQEAKDLDEESVFDPDVAFSDLLGGNTTQ